MGTSIIASDMQRKLVTEDAVVRAYAEALNAAPYADCATPANYNAAPPPNFDPSKWVGYQASVVTVAYWNGDNPATFGSSCTSDSGVQRLSLEAHSSTTAVCSTSTL